MRWSETVTLPQPLRAVRLASAGPADEQERLRQREQAAYERGLADGERSLAEQLLQQRGELLELQNGVLLSLRNAVPHVVQQSESALIELALEVAKKLVDGLPVSVEMIEANLRAALAQAEETAEFVVQLHPEDLALLQTHGSGLLSPDPGTDRMRFQASTEVTRGGCLVQTHFGLIDARRETKLERLKESIAR